MPNTLEISGRVGAVDVRQLGRLVRDAVPAVDHGMAREAHRDERCAGVRLAVAPHLRCGLTTGSGLEFAGQVGASIACMHLPPCSAKPWFVEERPLARYYSRGLQRSQDPR